MTCLNDLGRRSFLTIAAALGDASTVGALPNLAGAEDTAQQTGTPAITLQDVPFSSGAKLTIERRGQIVLFGINRPYIQNRIDPETFEKLAEADTGAAATFLMNGRPMHWYRAGVLAVIMLPASVFSSA